MILKIPTLAQNESTRGSNEETSYKPAYDSFLSILYLKNTDQMKYGSLIKKMAEDFATGWDDRIPSTNPGAEPPRDARDSGSDRSHSTHLEASSSDRP